MPIINVEIFPGRTTDQKKRIAERLTDSMVEICGAKPEAVHVIFTEVAATDWAVAGQLCSERAAAAAKAS
jgi:4-oxalocrotonate tautomerase